MRTLAKAVALYFPQLHPVPENDAWWGPGFTDWVNVKKARPLYPGHHQPRVPRGGRYYDQSRDDTIRWQVDLARAHGVHAFCHYHYWFDGKQLLETPTNRFLAMKDLDLRFCLAWANETWSRRWDGREREILVRQTHPVDKARWELHFQYLLRAFTDPRALTVDGRPVFLLYRPHLVAEIDALFDYFRERAHDHGLPGLHLVAMAQGWTDPAALRHFDAVMAYEPFHTYYGLRSRHLWRRALAGARDSLPDGARRVVDRVTTRVLGAVDRRVPAVVDYDEVWRAIVTRPLRVGGLPTFPGAFVDWDNTARYGHRATIFRGASPERFAFWLRRLVGALGENRPEERLLFVTAWNEWAEGAYLEPDERNGTAYIEALRDALAAGADGTGDAVQPDQRPVVGRASS